MRPNRLRRLLILAFFGAIAAGSGLGTGIARADVVDVYVTWKAENVCNWLSLHPQASSVEPLFKAIQDDTGFSGEDVARVLAAAVATSCPESMIVLQRFVDVNAPAAPVVAR